jgi:DNA-binding SARP family transcriptional activator
MTGVKLDVLGKPILTGLNGPGLVGKPLAVLIYLLVHLDRVTRDHLATMFWPNQPREKALQSLRQSIFLIRKLDPDLLLQDGETLRLNTTRLMSDFTQFNDAIAQHDLMLATSLWRGDFADNFTIAGAPQWTNWVESMRDLLRNRFAALVSVASEEARAALDVGGALDLAQRAIEIQPYEISHRTRLINFQLDAGDVAAADATLKDTRRDFDDTEYVEMLNQLELRLRGLTHDRLRNPYESLAAPELVGRSAELSMIARAWSYAKRRSTQVVAIIGPGGIGKSRLAEEAMAAAAHDGASCASAKASPGDEVVPFATVGSLIGRLLRLAGAAGISTASETVLTSIAPRFARSGNVTVEPAVVAVGDALIDLVSAIAYEQSLFLVLDDLQWADAQSRNILKRLVRELQNEPVLFVLNYRKDELQREVATALERLERETAAERIVLADLSAADVEELLAGTINFEDSLHIALLAAAVHDVTGGRPYLISELLQRLADESLLQFDDGRWVLRKNKCARALESAGSRLASVERRLDELDTDELSLATALASLPTTSTLDRVRKDARLDAAVFTRTVGRLVERRVLRWHDNQLAFAQDTLRERLRLRGLQERQFKSRRQTVQRVAIAVAVVAVMLGAWVGTMDPVYGGGTLMFSYADTLVEMTPPKLVSGRWRVTKTPLRLPEYANLRSVQMDANGQRWQYLVVDPIEASPYPALIGPNGKYVVLNQRENEDGGDGAVSPDGEWVTYTEDYPNTEKYDLYVYKSRVDGSDRTLLRTSMNAGNVRAWSSDGARIMIMAAGPTQDTLVFVNPLGTEINRIAVPKNSNWSWCNDYTVVSPAIGDTLIREINIKTRATRVLANIRPVSAVACSPDNNAVVVVGIVDGERKLVVVDRRTRAIRPIRHDGDFPARNIRDLWWPTAPRQAIAASINIVNPPRSLRWGDSASLAYDVRYIGKGEKRPPAARWTSSDEAIAFVDESGKVFANKPGRATIIVQTLEYLADTTVIEIQRTPEDPATFRHTFAKFDTTLFHVMGAPVPYQGHFQGEGVLVIPGDGNYNEGVMTKEAFALPRGGMVEVEFMLSLTRDDRQFFSLALMQADLVPGRDPRQHHGWMVRESLGINYPIQGTRTGVGIESSNIPKSLPNTPMIQPNQWNHFAIQIQPDGYASYFINRQRVHRSPVRVDNAPGAKWRLNVAGSGFATKLYVRNLVLWEQPPRW